jgi:hypothetical protein
VWYSHYKKNDINNGDWAATVQAVVVLLVVLLVVVSSHNGVDTANGTIITTDTTESVHGPPKGYSCHPSTASEPPPPLDATTTDSDHKHRYG